MVLNAAWARSPSASARARHFCTYASSFWRESVRQNERLRNVGGSLGQRGMSGHDDDGYAWEIGVLRAGRLPGKSVYVLGRPIEGENLNLLEAH